MPHNLPIVRTLGDIDRHAGGDVLVQGIYVVTDVRKAPTETAPTAGHPAIRLDDGTLVLLGLPQPVDSGKDASEREDLVGKQVVAEGMMNPVAPPGPGASLQVPCLFPLLYVVTPEVHRLLHAL